MAAGANKGIPFLSHRGCSSRHQPRVLTAESEAGTARCTQPLTAAPLHCNRHVSPPFSLSPFTSSSSSSSSSHKGSNWEPLHQQSLGGRRDCIWSNEATGACLETLTHFAPPQPNSATDTTQHFSDSAFPQFPQQPANVQQPPKQAWQMGSCERFEQPRHSSPISLVANAACGEGRACEWGRMLKCA